MIRRLRGRDVLIGLSLANLGFIRVWAMLVSTQNDYYRDAPPSALWALTALGGVVLLAVGLVAGKLLMDSPRIGPTARRALSLCFLGMVVIVLNGVRQQVVYSLAESGASDPSRQQQLATLATFLCAGVVVLGCLTAWRRGLPKLVQACTAATLIMFPFFLVTSARALHVAFSSGLSSRFSDAPRDLSPGNISSGYRVVVIVFDGLDVDLPDGMPAFEKLRSTSINWANAYPRTSRTIDSLPALITGRPITSARPTGAGKLLLSSDDTPSEYSWTTTESLFTKAREIGARSALAGWYHPYCRLLRDLASCASYPYEPRATKLMDVLREQRALLADTVPFAFRGGFARKMRETRFEGQTLDRWHAELYEQIQRNAIKAVRDPDIDLVFVHYPVPHAPYVADLVVGRATGRKNYAGNVALADRALGDLRDAITASGLADRTALVVTSDHWNRGQEEGGQSIRPVVGELMHRVPLVTHLPNQVEPYVIEAPIENVSAHYLALSLLGGNLRRVEDLPTASDGWPAWIHSPRRAE